MSQEGNAASFFDLIDDPVPVAHGFEGNRRAFRVLGEEGTDGARDVPDPSPLDQVPFPVEDREE